MSAIDTDSIDNAFDSLLANRSIVGGAADIQDVNNRPTGGFLPIIKCAKKDMVEEENKNREFKEKKNTLTIMDIMRKRRRAKPMFS